MSSAVVHVIMLSVGQAFLNPRINEYSATIAPKVKGGMMLKMLSFWNSTIRIKVSKTIFFSFAQFINKLWLVFC